MANYKVPFQKNSYKSIRSFNKKENHNFPTVIISEIYKKTNKHSNYFIQKIIISGKNEAILNLGSARPSKMEKAENYFNFKVRNSL